MSSVRPTDSKETRPISERKSKSSEKFANNQILQETKTWLEHNLTLRGMKTNLESKRDDEEAKSSPNKLEEKNSPPNAGVTQTGLIINYWKNEARNPSFWNQHPYHGNASRKKPLFKDDYMSLFITNEISSKAKEMLDPKLALALAVRHKYFNKALSNSVKSKDIQTKQIIILGSGYDTRPVRKQKYTATFFEIDKKDVLDNKKNIYKKNQVNPNAIYIGIDYLQEDFIEHLKKAGLDTTLSTHFIWEGNTMYLPEEKITYVLEQIKKSFSGTTLVSFDYISKDVIRKSISIPETSTMLDKFKKSKAPMITGYNDIRKEIADKTGLTVVENRVCADLTKEYGAGDTPYVSQDNYFLCTLRV